MNTFNIVSNASGTRTMTITEENLEVIKQYSLFKNLVGSNGIVDDSVLTTLKSFVGGLIDSTSAADAKLVRFYKDVLAHPNMKSVGLANLIELYAHWLEENPEKEEE